MIKCLQKLKNRIILLMLSLCVLLSLTGCSSATEKSYQTGVALLEQGRFEEASNQFQELGSYRDASLLLMYSRVFPMCSRIALYVRRRRKRLRFLSGMERTGMCLPLPESLRLWTPS